MTSVSMTLTDRLIAALGVQAACVGELLALAREKHGVIVENDTAALKTITRLESAILAKNAEAERERLEVMGGMASVYSRNPVDFNISSLLPLLTNNDEKDRLASVTAQIKSSSAALTAENERNHVLIENALDYIGFSINLIREAKTDEPLYYSADGDEISSSAVFFDKAR